MSIFDLFKVIVPRVNLNISKVDLTPVLEDKSANDIVLEYHSE